MVAISGPWMIPDDWITGCGTEEEMSPTTLARRSTWIACLSALVLDVSVPHATTVERMTFSEVVRGAAVIAAGTVSTVDTVWDPDQERPFTEVTFEDEDLEVLKGEVGQRPLTLRFLGGKTPGGLVLRVSGMPRFEVGQKAVVFSSSPDGAAICPLVGWWQGLYRIVHDAKRDVLTVADHAGRPVAGFDGVVGERVVRLSARAGAAKAPKADTASPADDALTLAAFRDLIGDEL